MRDRRRRRASRLWRTLAVLVAAIVIAGIGGVVLASALTRPLTAATSTPTPPAVAGPDGPAPTTTPTTATIVDPPAPVETPPPPPPAPVSPAALPCATSTLLTVWAHTDDDIIFANPAISDAIAEGRCVRSVFLTAGDAGKPPGYSRSRELGILRAYNVMRGQPGQLWNQAQLTLLSGEQATQFVPQNEDRLSILFLRLPDGGLDGGGFGSTGHASLPKLLDGAVSTLAPIDGGPAVSLDTLRATVREIASAYAPSEVLTHIPRGTGVTAGDHPDHSVVGTLVRDAALGGAMPRESVRYYIGYPSQNMPVNVTGDALKRKVDTYRVYAKEDPVLACADNSACLARAKFGAWLQRSYSLGDAELGLG